MSSLIQRAMLKIDLAMVCRPGNKLPVWEAKTLIVQGTKDYIIYRFFRPQDGRREATPRRVIYCPAQGIAGTLTV